MKTWLAVLLIAVPASAGDLLVGAGAAKITPPAGMPMGGGFTIRLSTGVHEDLYCKAIAFGQDGAKAALVACDVESLHRPTVEQARRIIDGAGGIRGAAVMIAATHSHSGPEMTPLVLEGAQGDAKRLADAYHAELPARIAEAVRLAEANLKPARVWAGVGQETGVSFNRRYLMKDGTVRMNPGQLNPGIVRAAGPIDPALHVTYFDSPEGEPLATQVNFALHATTWGRADFAPDYPGVLAKLLADAKHPSMATIFTQGCSGNINQVNVRTKERQSGPAKTAQVGTVLAADVIRLYQKLRQVPAGGVTVKSAYVALPVSPVSAEQVRAARATIEESRRAAKGGPSFLELVHAFRVVNVAERHGNKPVNAEVQVIALGDQVAWIGLPGEVFTELGMALKKASPFPYTVVNELSNDMLDYVPDRKAYPQGAYEVTTARCTEGCGELLVDAATRLAMEVYREATASSAAGLRGKL